MKKILLTGGGSAGHVTPNIALFPSLKKLGYEIQYIGTYDGIEKKLIEELGIPYTGISSGKLRRYMSIKNFSDPFRVIKGYGEAKKFIKNYKPDIVFSKGGFVSVPVVLAAKKYKIPVIIHESDMTPGLANKLSISSATLICHNFPETSEYLPKEKAILTGSPIREELRHGNKFTGLDLCGFSANKPVVMVVGGSLGAKAINNSVRDALPELLKTYQIVHLCGKGKLDETLTDITGYKQFEYIKEEMKDLFAMADLIVSRAGANAICEIQALCKPNILIPLPATASRGDQILNAASFEKQGFSKVVAEEDVTTKNLIDAIHEVYNDRQNYINAMSEAKTSDAVSTIIDLIEDIVNNKNS